MKNKGTLIRTFFALSLILALGVAPGLSAYAQQAAQKPQPAPRAEVAAEQAMKASEEKPPQPSDEDELIPLSDEEMQQVEGGANWGKALGKAVGWLGGLLGGGGKAPAPAYRNTVIVNCGRR
ncbi:MAG TPA: hypothetical protein VN282_05510 [Pyrinomonadaceae bacterium]|nr:hypothetical protein [Pyrinomonadaceae bacterium]